MKIFNIKKSTVSAILSIIIGICLGVVVYFEFFTKTDHGYDVFRSRTELRYEGLKDSLVTVTDLYIQTIAPGSCLNGMVLVEEADRYGLDLKFVLAQAHIESHFGTKGVARKTNSVFNVFSYDGLSADQILRSGRGYSHPDHSVEPYMKLITKRYLSDGRTEYDLMDKFVDPNGARYATDKNYEAKLLDCYNKMDEIVNFGVYAEYLKIKTILAR